MRAVWGPCSYVIVAIAGWERRNFKARCEPAGTGEPAKLHPNARPTTESLTAGTPAGPSTRESPPARHGRKYTWAELMKRVWALDVLRTRLFHRKENGLSTRIPQTGRAPRGRMDRHHRTGIAEENDLRVPLCRNVQHALCTSDSRLFQSPIQNDAVNNYLFSNHVCLSSCLMADQNGFPLSARIMLSANCVAIPGEFSR